MKKLLTGFFSASLLLLFFQSCSIVDTTCSIITLPLLIPVYTTIIAIEESKKDISNGFDVGHVVNKEYELVQEMYLIHEIDNVHRYLQPEEGNKCKHNYLTHTRLPKGTKFKVCEVYVNTYEGVPSSCSSIIAHFVDEHGNCNPYQKQDTFGWVSPLVVTNLFTELGYFPRGEDILFKPNAQFICEVKKY